MIISDEDLLEFFKSKVECAVGQIKSRGLRIATGSYRIEKRRVDNTWVLEPTHASLHPLDLILENQKTLHDKSKTGAIARRLNCNTECITSFNAGLRSAMGSLPKKKSLEYKFFAYGQKVREKHFSRKRKPLTRIIPEHVGDMDDWVFGPMDGIADGGD